MARSTEAPPDVIGIHGLFLGNSASWFFLLKQAAGPGASIATYDLPGHGLSPACGASFGLKDQVAVLDELIDALGCERPLILVGHSYGAMVALDYGLQFPDRVAKLVLVEPPYPLSQGSEFAAFLRKTPEQMIEVLPPEVARNLRQGGRQGKKWLQRLRTLVQETSILHDLQDAEQWEMTGDLRSTIPVWWVAGESSSCLQGIQALHRRTPHGVYREVAGGHYLLSENPEAVIRVVQECLHA